MPRRNRNAQQRDVGLERVLVERSLDGATFPWGTPGSRSFDGAAVRKNERRRQRRGRRR